jgi:hypothetical protein
MYFHNVMFFVTGAMTESYLSEKKKELARQIVDCPQFQSKLECHRRCHMKMKAIWSTGVDSSVRARRHARSGRACRRARSVRAHWRPRSGRACWHARSVLARRCAHSVPARRGMLARALSHDPWCARSVRARRRARPGRACRHPRSVRARRRACSVKPAGALAQAGQSGALTQF